MKTSTQVSILHRSCSLVKVVVQSSRSSGDSGHRTGPDRNFCLYRLITTCSCQSAPCDHAHIMSLCTVLLCWWENTSQLVSFLVSTLVAADSNVSPLFQAFIPRVRVTIIIGYRVWLMDRFPLYKRTLRVAYLNHEKNQFKSSLKTWLFVQA